MNYFEDYKKGNAQQRLELYMQFRDLRHDFDFIENGEVSTQAHHSPQIVIEHQKTNIKQSRFVRLKNCCLSILS